MASTEAEIRERGLDEMAELGTRSVSEQGGGNSKYLCLHEVAVINLDIGHKDEMTQYLDPEQNRIIIEPVSEEEEEEHDV